MREPALKRYADAGADSFWMEGKRRLLFKILENQPDLHLGNGNRVLDLGCGPGSALEGLRRWGWVVGTDAAFTCLDRCRERSSRVPLVQSRAESLPFREGQFSLVVAMEILEHLEEDLAVLAECRRLLRPGGWLAVTVPAFNGLWGGHDELNGHLRRYRRGELAGKLARAGLEPVRVTYCHALFLPPLWALRRFKAIFPVLRRKDDFISLPPVLDRALTALVAAEGRWLRQRDLPFGTGLIALARRR